MFRGLCKLITFIRSIQLMMITHVPGSSGHELRNRFWRKRLKYLGKHTKIDTGVFFQNPRFISIGDYTWIDKDVIILAGLDDSKREKIMIRNSDYVGDPGVVYIGNRVHVAPGCILSGISAGLRISDECNIAAHSKIYAFSHHYRSKRTPQDTGYCFGPQVAENRQCMLEGPVYLGRNTGVGLNGVILPGVSIRDNCFVKINSVVHAGLYSRNSILSGDPARVTGERFRTGK
jgi:acetyltransferase-like isoleucine patch superfamily enzyme